MNALVRTPATLAHDIDAIRAQRVRHVLLQVDRSLGRDPLPAWPCVLRPDIVRHAETPHAKGLDAIDAHTERDGEVWARVVAALRERGWDARVHWTWFTRYVRLTLRPDPRAAKPAAPDPDWA